MDELTFNKIDRARKLLGLGESATLEEVKEAYRGKAKKFHPDKKHTDKKKIYGEKMVQINWAYETILKYIEEYAFSFRKEDIEKNSPGRDMKRFSEDWLRK